MSVFECIYVRNKGKNSKKYGKNGNETDRDTRRTEERRSSERKKRSLAITIVVKIQKRSEKTNRNKKS